MKLTRQQKQTIVAALTHAMAATEGKNVVEFEEYRRTRKQIERALKNP
jgi:hypothetical protein